MKLADTSVPPDGVLNQERLMYYSANWQLLEERVDDDADAQEPVIDRHMQYIWGPRYIDDIILRRQNRNFGNDDPDITYEDHWYHLTDALFSTVAIITQSGSVVERVSYDPYGRARHHRYADLNGDGVVDVLDQLMLQDNWGNYGVGDLNRDGVVDILDLLMLNDNWGAALPDGRLSSAAVDNVIGYASYVFNAELPGAGLYTVRHRHYDPDLGRWIHRDPLGYVDGMGLYQYKRGVAVSGADPSGLLFIPFPFSPSFPLIPRRPRLPEIPFPTVPRWPKPKRPHVPPEIPLVPSEQKQDQLAGCLLDYGVSDCWEGYWCAQDAKNISDPYPNDGSRGAMRHCLWTCCMATAVGPGRAFDISDDHERYNPGDPLDERRDLCNNYEGVECALQGLDCTSCCHMKLLNDELIKYLDDPRLCDDCN